MTVIIRPNATQAEIEEQLKKKAKKTLRCI